jgi:WD40 repeat protein
LRCWDRPTGAWRRAVTELDVDALLARRAEIERAVKFSAIPARKVFPEEATVREVGRILFGALLGAGEVAGCYRVATSLAAERGEGLRVVLRIADSALAALPWETMYDDGAGVYVCRRDQLVRHVGVLASVQSLPVEPPLRILGIVSSPRGLARLDVDKEKEQLAGVLSRLTSDAAAHPSGSPQPPAATAPRRRFAWLRSPAASPVRRVPSRLVRTINTLSDGVFGVSFSPHGTLLASAGANHTVRLWASEAEVVLRAVRFPANYDYILPAKYENFVDFPAKSNFGDYSAHWRNEFEFWNWVFERLSRGVIEAPYRRVIAAGLRLQGENAVLGDLQRRYAMQFDGLATDRTRVLIGHSGLVLRVAFSPDGSLLASAGQDGKVLLRSMADKTIASSIADPGVRALAFSPDGTQIATAGDRHALRVWSVSSRTLNRSYVGHTGPVHAVAFSPHGYPLASAGLDGTVQVWE